MYIVHKNYLLLFLIQLQAVSSLQVNEKYFLKDKIIFERFLKIQCLHVF